MKKIKFMLLSLALVAVVGAALAFKVKYTDTFCYTFAQRVNAASPYTCSIAGQPVLTCVLFAGASTITEVAAGVRPVCTAPLFNGTCGDAIHPLPCFNATTSIKVNN